MVKTGIFRRTLASDRARVPFESEDLDARVRRGKDQTSHQCDTSLGGPDEPADVPGRLVEVPHSGRAV